MPIPVPPPELDLEPNNLKQFDVRTEVLPMRYPFYLALLGILVASGCDPKISDRMHSEHRREVVRHRNKHNSAIRESWNAMTGYQLTNAPLKATTRTCEDAPTGGLLTESPHLYSADGALTVTLSYVTSVGSEGNVRFCYLTPDGKQNPTLHLKAGEHLRLQLRNETTLIQSTSSMAMDMSGHGAPCGSAVMTDQTTNLHFHGTSAKPVCHQDDALRTMVNPGESFDYDVVIPVDEPPGLHWYHPHIHGLSEAATQGGASGAIVIEGIEQAVAEVRGLPQRLIVVRDHLLPPGVTETETMPAWDLSINGSLIRYPSDEHPSATMIANRDEVWRVLNSAADAMIDLEVDYDGIAQPLTIVALDGVPVNLRSTAAVNKGPKTKGAPSTAPSGNLLTATHYLLAPGNRVEFIISPPNASVKVAKLITRYVDTGPGGDLDPMRPLLDIKLAPKLPATPDASIAGNVLPQTTTGAVNQRFAGLDTTKPTITRKLYFSSEDRNDDTDFYIVVDGTEPTLFNPHLPPAITTTQGTTEDWVIENRTQELHSFHIHQIHFLLLERNGVAVTEAEKQYMDVINVPYWTGEGPYPTVKLRMDFRGDIAGDFMYHCHILEHEDKGMMAVIRVLPARGQSPHVTK